MRVEGWPRWTEFVAREPHATCVRLNSPHFTNMSKFIIGVERYLMDTSEATLPPLWHRPLRSAARFDGEEGQQQEEVL